MKKALKITGIILLAIIIVIGVIAAMNWKYISAVYSGLTMDEEELGQQRVENTQDALDKVNSFMDVELRPLTDEEKEKIQSGDLSQTEIMAQLIAQATGIELTGTPSDTIGDATGDADSATTGENAGGGGGGGSAVSNTQAGQTGSGSNPPAGASSKPAAQASSSDQLIAACVNKLYGLQTQYTAQLDGLAARARAYYNEQKAASGSAAAKTSTMSKFSGEVTSMESSCDAKVEAALSELSSGLSAIGAGTSIVDELRQAYQKEKSNQRAAYVNRYVK